MHFFIYKFEALFGSKLRATKYKLVSRKIAKRCPILLISSNLAFLAPLGQFLTGAELIRKNVPKRYICLDFVKNACHWLLSQPVMRILIIGVYLQNQLCLGCC